MEPQAASTGSLLGFSPRPMVHHLQDQVHHPHGGLVNGQSPRSISGHQRDDDDRGGTRPIQNGNSSHLGNGTTKSDDVLFCGCNEEIAIISAVGSNTDPDLPRTRRALFSNSMCTPSEHTHHSRTDDHRVSRNVLHFREIQGLLDAAPPIIPSSSQYRVTSSSVHQVSSPSSTQPHAATTPTTATAASELLRTSLQEARCTFSTPIFAGPRYGNNNDDQVDSSTTPNSSAHNSRLHPRHNSHRHVVDATNDLPTTTSTAAKRRLLSSWYWDLDLTKKAQKIVTWIDNCGVPPTEGDQGACSWGRLGSMTPDVDGHLHDVEEEDVMNSSSLR